MEDTTGKAMVYAMLAIRTELRAIGAAMEKTASSEDLMAQVNLISREWADAEMWAGRAEDMMCPAPAIYEGGFDE
jgi:hypothetical protein